MHPNYFKFHYHERDIADVKPISKEEVSFYDRDLVNTKSNCLCGRDNY